MSIENIASRFRELSADEKIRLVQELWDEIAKEVERAPPRDSQRRLLDERLAGTWRVIQLMLSLGRRRKTTFSVSCEVRTPDQRPREG